MTPNDPQEPEQLAAQAQWLRRLAVGLVGGQDADDVVQETLLVALRRPLVPAAGEGALRAWLSGIARNIVRSGRRDGSRRHHREQDYQTAQPAHAPGTDEVVDRAARGAELLEAVLALDEPYRTAVLLAYEERLSAPAIARRTGATPAAVRKRISRGLATLRARLDAESGGEGRAWLTAFAGLAVPPAASLGPWTLGVTMTAKWAAAAATILVLVGLGIWSSRGGGTDRLVALALEDQGVEALSDNADVLNELALVSAPELRDAAPSAAPAAASAPARFTGRVLLTDDRTPVANAAIQAGAGPGGDFHAGDEQRQLATTDRLGQFTLELESEQANQLLDPAQISRTRGQLIEVRTVPLGQVLVTVVDADGNRAAGIDVSYDLDATIGSDAQLWSYQRDRPAGTSDAQGELLVEGLPVGMNVSFGVRGEWSMPAQTVIDAGSGRAEVTLVLQGWATITARLEWPDGSPAPDVEAEWIGSSHRSGSMGGVQAKSDGAGLLKIADLSTGGGQLNIFGTAFHEPLNLRVARGATTDVGVLTVTPLVMVEGHVLAPRGQPLPPGLQVAAFRSGVFLAANAVQGDRSFRLQLPPGPVLLGLSNGIRWNPILPYRGTFLGQAHVHAPQSEVELELAASYTRVTGNVGVAGSQVEVALFDGEPNVDWTGRARPRETGDAQAEADGSFLCQVQPDHARVLVRLPDGRTAYSGLVHLEAGRIYDLGKMDWAPGILEVLAIDLDGTPQTDSLVRVQDSANETFEQRTDEDGRARFELAAGPYALRAETPGGASGHWEPIQVESGATANVDLGVTEKAVLRGSISGPNGPLAGIQIQCQRSNPISNLILSATTDRDGQFAFQPMLPGTYRYHTSGDFVSRTELRSGEEKVLRLEVGIPPTLVEVFRDGQPLAWASRLVVSAWGTGETVWRMGESLGAGRFQAPLPPGPLMFSLDLDGLGNNQHVLVPGPAASGGEYRLELPSSGLELRLEGAAAHRPNPAGYLVQIEGVQAVTQWGPNPELFAEDHALDPDGTRTVRFPFLAPGSEVRLSGVGSSGEQRSETVSVVGGGWTVVRWD